MQTIDNAEYSRREEALFDTYFTPLILRDALGDFVFDHWGLQRALPMLEDLLSRLKEPLEELREYDHLSGVRSGREEVICVDGY